MKYILIAIAMYQFNKMQRSKGKNNDISGSEYKKTTKQISNCPCILCLQQYAL